MEFDIYGSVENPWFNATQVAELISYNTSSYNIGKLLRLVRERDKKISRIDASARTLGTGRSKGQRRFRDIWMINEDGVYDILMRSNTEIAKFVREEFRDLLKRMRRSGGLRTKDEFSSRLINYDLMYLALEKHPHNDRKATEYYEQLKENQQ